jgi:hypothetical protein
MARPSHVPRPTEGAALNRCPNTPSVPPAARLADLLIAARATGDRYGARHFDHLLDRALAQR